MQYNHFRTFFFISGSSLCVIWLLMLGACSPSRMGTASIHALQDGTSFPHAIIIHQTDEDSGVDAEYHWLDAHYPGYRLAKQSMVKYHRKPYDLLEIVNVSGTDKIVFFDISHFYGKGIKY